MFSFCVQSPVQQKLTAILSPIDRKIASRQNSGKNNFFYRDRIGVLISILGVLVGVFDVLAGIFLIQSSPFRVPCGKKVRRLEKSTLTPLVALLTNIKYGTRRKYTRLATRFLCYLQSQI